MAIFLRQIFAQFFTLRKVAGERIFEVTNNGKKQ